MSIRFLLCFAFPWALIILARWAPRFLFLFHVSFCYPGSWTSFFRFPLLYPPHNVRTAFFNVVFPYLNAPFFIYVYAAIFRFFLPALGSLFACNESAYFSCGSFLLYTPWAGILRKVPLLPSLAILFPMSFSSFHRAAKLNYVRFDYCCVSPSFSLSFFVRLMTACTTRSASCVSAFVELRSITIVMHSFWFWCHVHLAIVLVLISYNALSLQPSSLGLVEVWSSVATSVDVHSCQGLETPCSCGIMVLAHPWRRCLILFPGFCSALTWVLSWLANLVSCNIRRLCLGFLLAFLSLAWMIPPSLYHLCSAIPLGIWGISREIQYGRI